MEKKKKNIKFNALDFLIILMIIGMVAIVIFQKDIKKFTDNNEYGDIVYSFTVNNITSERARYLAEGSTLTELSGDEAAADMGTILTSQSENYVLDVTLVDGSVESAELTGVKNVRCTAKMTAIKKENGYFTENGTMIVPGRSIKIETSRAVFEIKIESVSDRVSDVN
ncbi:MAG: DUF4330 family protein [Clostridia bacterium]|nr:DUF4330 family protein [Clostridia bacterium]